MFSLVSRKFLAMRNIVLYSVCQKNKIQNQSVRWKTFWDQATFTAAISHQTAAKHRGEKHVIRSMYFRGGKGPATATRVVLYVIPRGVTFWSWYLIRKCTLTNYLEHRDAIWPDDVHCLFLVKCIFTISKVMRLASFTICYPFIPKILKN